MSNERKKKWSEKTKRKCEKIKILKRGNMKSMETRKWTVKKLNYSKFSKKFLNEFFKTETE